MCFFNSVKILRFHYILMSQFEWPRLWLLLKYTLLLKFWHCDDHSLDWNKIWVFKFLEMRNKKILLKVPADPKCACCSPINVGHVDQQSQLLGPFRESSENTSYIFTSSNVQLYAKCNRILSIKVLSKQLWISLLSS